MEVISRKEVLRQIMAEKREQKQRAESLADRKRMEIAEKVPIYGNLSGAISRILMNANRAVLDAPEKGEEISEAAKRQVKELQKQAEDALFASGYTKDDLKPRYVCDKCRDTGFVGEPIHEYCSCVKTALVQRLFDQAGVSEENFGNFDLLIFSDEKDAKTGKSQREVMESYKTYCEAYVKDFPNPKRKNLLFWGNTGLGKSFMLNCIAAGLLEKGVPVLRLSSYKMLEAMRRTHRGQDDSDFDLMLSCDVLIIDDLGTEPMLENITLEYLFTLLNERRGARKPTLIATNLSMQELKARYAERIFSRISDKAETQVLPFVGADVRLRVR